HIPRAFLEVLTKLQRKNEDLEKRGTSALKVENLERASKESDFDQGHIVQLKNGLQGTVWKKPKWKVGFWWYKVYVRKNEEDFGAFSKVKESELTFKYPALDRTRPFELLEGDVILDRRFGYSRHLHMGDCEQLAKVPAEGQYGPGNMFFKTDASNAKIVEPGYTRVARILYFLQRQKNIGEAAKLVDLSEEITEHSDVQVVVRRILLFLKRIAVSVELMNELVREVLKGSGFKNHNINVTDFLELAAATEEPVQNSANGFAVHQTRVAQIKEEEKAEVRMETRSVAEEKAETDLKHLCDQRMQEEGNDTQDRRYISKDPEADSERKIPEGVRIKRPSTFDTRVFAKYEEMSSRKKLSTREKIEIEMENLSLIGVTGGLAGVRFPEGGIQVSKDLHRRLSYVGYSTLDMEGALKVGNRTATDPTTLRELDLVKNPPKLKKKTASAVRKFCSERDSYLTDLSKLYNVHGEMYAPQDLLTCTDINVKDWLASVLGVPMEDLSVLHIDAFMIVCRKFDPYSTDVDVEVSDLLKAQKVHYEIGETIQSYMHSLLAQTKRLIKTYDILDIINRDPKCMKSCVEAVCSHLPRDNKVEKTKEYCFAIKNPKNAMYKNFFEFLEHLLANCDNYSKITKYSFYEKQRAAPAQIKDRGWTKIHNYSAKPASESFGDNTDELEEQSVEIAFQAVMATEKVCWGCGEKNHTLRDCPKKLSEEEKKKIVKDQLKIFKEKTKKVYSTLNNKGLDKRGREMVKEKMINFIFSPQSESEEDSDSSDKDSDTEESDTSKDEPNEAEVGHFLLSGDFTSIHDTVGVSSYGDSREEAMMANVGKLDKESARTIEEELWKRNATIDKISNNRKVTLFPNDEYQDGLSVNLMGSEGVEARYLGDCGCLGMNLGGKELLDAVKERQLPFEVKEVQAIPVRCAWHDKQQITHVLRAAVACQTKFGYPLVERDVFIHILDKPLGTVYFGTRFCEKLGLKTVNQQID
ncbi:MAG TPA: hypothetical protein VGD31_11770, partial [Sphingobacteriaceae bacterium]